jgi:hypothetical protein
MSTLDLRRAHGLGAHRGGAEALAGGDYLGEGITA